ASGFLLFGAGKRPGISTRPDDWGTATGLDAGRSPQQRQELRVALSQLLAASNGERRERPITDWLHNRYARPMGI
ncbi:hypothetical protein, partial [Thiocapsa sp.]|uniref:hypothetical protein n=1 Tax=Thiocapsa sp. TaxID=2024551 RepID=UPI0035943C58